MKKTTILLAVLMLSTIMFTACSGGSAPKSDEKTETTVTTESKEVKIETFDGGNISVDIPEGYKAFNTTMNGENDPNGIIIGKGFESTMDMMSKPYIQITYNKGDGATVDTLLKNAKAMYDVKDTETFKTDNYTWNGFSYDVSGASAVYYIAQLEDDALILSGFTESGGEKISLEDETVKQIIDSIKITAK